LGGEATGKRSIGIQRRSWELFGRRPASLFLTRSTMRT
jgi:hypothetical protein